MDWAIHAQEFTHRQDAADIVDILRIRGVYKLVAADEHSGDVPDHEVPDDALHHGHSDLLLLQVLLKECQVNSGQFNSFCLFLSHPKGSFTLSVCDDAAMKLVILV